MAGKKYPPNEQLRHARELRGWGQRDVAEKLSATREGETQIVVDERAIRRWETGESLPTPFYRQRLCEVFGMNAEELGFLPPAPVLANPSLLAAPTEKGSPAFPAAPRDKDRQRLLKKVQAFWIDGVLEHSLSQAVLLHLGLEERPDALANPWHLALQQPDLPARLLPPNTTIESVYEQAQGEVLILGEPGAGKTTLLLVLARSLVERARLDESQPLPVVLHLSSWAVRHQPLEQWLVEELHEKYQVPRALGRRWIEDDQVLLLLDGLDEVDSAFRTGCIEAINAYTPNHAVPLVACSRRTEYFAQTARLRLTTAVLVQPLTPEQIDAYLGQLGEDLAPLRHTIQHTLELQDLVQTPLMLSILLLASQGHPVEEVLALSGSLESQRQQLFTLYVERMLQRRSPTTRYTPQQTARWLTWLARQLKVRSQTVFYLEFMQPKWLPAGWPAQLYQRLIICFWAGLVVGTIYGFAAGLQVGIATYTFLGMLFWLWIVLLFTVVGTAVIGPWAFLVKWLLAHWLPQQVSRVFGGIVSALLGGFLAGWLYGLFVLLVVPAVGLPAPHFTFVEWVIAWVRPATTISSVIALVCVFEGRSTTPIPWRSWRNGWVSLREALLIGLLGGVVLPDGVIFLVAHRLVPYFSWTGDNLLLDTLLQIPFTVTWALPTIFFTKGIAFAIQPVEVVVWSWRRARQGMRYGILLGLLFGPLGTIFIWFTFHSLGFKIAWMGFYLLFGAFFGVLLGGLSGGVSKTILEEGARLRPNQLIWRSARNALRAGAIGGLICALFLLLVSIMIVVVGSYNDELVGDVVVSLLVGTLLGALLGGIWVGGMACLQHVLLRFLLWRTKRAPWHYPRFLDYAAERILLQKVGGGYTFIHRLLLDHFALLETSAATQAEEPPSES